MRKIDAHRGACEDRVRLRAVGQCFAASCAHVIEGAGPLEPLGECGVAAWVAAQLACQHAAHNQHTVSTLSTLSARVTAQLAYQAARPFGLLDSNRLEFVCSTARTPIRPVNTAGRTRGEADEILNPGGAFVLLPVSLVY